LNQSSAVSDVFRIRYQSVNALDLELCRRVTLESPVFSYIRFDIDIHPSYDAYEVRCHGYVDLRNGGGRGKVQSTGFIRANELAQTRAIDGELSALKFVATQLRRQLLNHMAHELDEMLLVDGVRVFDPHQFESAAKT
jgi:hypothetical protein